jgi:hypothetical protein
MRFLMKISMPNEPFNTYLKNGTAGQVMQQILDDIKPEAAYFMEMRGRRGGILIVNMDDTSQIPHLAEAWFVKLDAQVELHPVMLPEDLAKAGLTELGKKWSQ